MANRWGNNGNSDRLYFWGSKITADGDCSHEIKRCLLLGRKSMTNLDSILKSRDITLLTKVCLFKALVFYSSHVSVWELDHKEGWTPKNWWCWRRLLKSPLDCKEIQPVNPKGNQEASILWPPDVKNWLIGKDPDATKDWSQEEKGMTEEEMVGWHQWLNGHEFKQVPGIGDKQGGLACCSLWDGKESDMTERLNNLSAALFR